MLTEMPHGRRELTDKALAFLPMESSTTSAKQLLQTRPVRAVPGTSTRFVDFESMERRDLTNC